MRLKMNPRAMVNAAVKTKRLPEYGEHDSLDRVVSAYNNLAALERGLKAARESLRKEFARHMARVSMDWTVDEIAEVLNLPDLY